MIVYPTSGYDSFVSVNDADTYFETRLHADDWLTADGEIALMVAYRSLQELDIFIDLTDADALQAIKLAQCEQALHEIRYDLDELQAQSVSLGGLVSVKLDRSNGEKPPRYSQRALAILKPYLRAPVISRIR
ncbi:MAG: hypothetical protein HGJ94_22160 [Desulfosarcina sp.]|nr:hypothetical protein [Desulfosarcina sp.]